MDRELIKGYLCFAAIGGVVIGFNLFGTTTCTTAEDGGAAGGGFAPTTTSSTTSSTGGGTTTSSSGTGGGTTTSTGTGGEGAGGSSIPPFTGTCTQDANGCIEASGGVSCRAIMDATHPSATGTAHLECTLSSGVSVAYADVLVGCQQSGDECWDGVGFGIGLFNVNEGDLLITDTTNNIVASDTWTYPGTGDQDVTLDCTWDTANTSASCTAMAGATQVGTAQASDTGTPPGDQVAIRLMEGTCCTFSVQ